jgi:beta-carotene 3-hydroxylase
MLIVINTLIILGAAIAMEGLAWLTHKYVMHGWGWHWHESHHDPGAHGFEWNDLFVVVPAGAAAGFMWADDGAWGPLMWIGVGITLYGVLYVIVHEGLAHGRWPLAARPRHPYVRRLVQAHRLHHAVRGRDGSVSFGFLYAPPVRTLRTKLKKRRTPYRPRQDAPPPERRNPTE